MKQENAFDKKAENRTDEAAFDKDTENRADEAAFDKNIENEADDAILNAYLKQLDADVPDLWDRIEAGIEKEKRGDAKNKTRKMRYVISGLTAAAVLLTALILAPWLNGRHHLTKEEESLYNDTAIKEEMSAGNQEEQEAVDSYLEEASEEINQIEADVSDDAAEGGLKNETVTEDARDSAQAETDAMDSAQAGNDATDSAQGGTNSVQADETRILEIRMVVESSVSNDGTMIYSGLIQEISENQAGLEAGSRISVILGETEEKTEIDAEKEQEAGTEREPETDTEKEIEIGSELSGVLTEYNETYKAWILKKN